MTSSGDFEKAARHRDEIALIKRRDHEEKHHLELQRQRHENHKLDEAFRKMTVAAKESLHGQEAMTSEECDAKLQAMEDSHAYERRALEEQIERILSRDRVRWSSRLLAMKDSLARLLKLQHYDEARELQRRIGILEAKETEIWTQTRQETMQTKRQKLWDRQDEEKKFMIQLIANTKLRAQRHRDAEYRLLQTRKRNIHHDMSHNHKLEMVGGFKREVLNATVQSRPNHGRCSATYMGSLLLEKHTGSKYNLPSLTLLDVELPPVRSQSSLAVSRSDLLSSL